MEIQGYSTLKQLVSDWIIDKYGSIEMGRYHQGLRWSVRKMIQLKIHLIPENKPVRLPVFNDPYHVKLPDDYVSFVAVGIDNNGEFFKFNQNSRMAMATDQECGDETQGTEEQQEIPDRTIWYTYSLEENNNRVMLHGYPYLDEVILLYVSTGVKMGGDTVIPAKIYEVLLSWLHYMAAKHNGGTQFEISESWETHKREVQMYQKTLFNLDKMYDILFDVVDKKK
jgi:hypothetical protein